MDNLIFSLMVGRLSEQRDQRWMAVAVEGLTKFEKHVPSSMFFRKLLFEKIPSSYDKIFGECHILWIEVPFGFVDEQDSVN